MIEYEQRQAAKQFAKDWEGRGYEKGESQPFWLALLRKVYGIEDPEQFINFEPQVHLDNTSFIDGYIPSTKVMIEQKGLGKDLNKPIKQSDGQLLTPFQQAKRYITELPVSQHPRWVVTCNFEEFYVYDMENPRGEPEKILLADLEKEYYRLQFLVDEQNKNLQREMEISIKAGDLVGILYSKLLPRYKSPDSPETLHSLNALCVRLVFCLFAEDAGIFGSHAMFHDYLRDVPASGMRRALADLFKVLDQKPEDRDPYLADDNPKLAAFPYVNGGLFADEGIEIPSFTDELKEVLLSKASEGFDWSEISPTIFGSVFESTLNPATRRSGGMHYTSIENIHKVIDPLFLDDLKKELEGIKAETVVKIRKAKLEAFQSKLSTLTFLDPACGSGNFLTETYICLRRLENETISELYSDQIVMGVINPIKVQINQFFGLEINDFAVSVAKTAMWIAECQMMRETEGIVHQTLDFLPLRSYTSIWEHNALSADWSDILPKNSLDNLLIFGNPPFVGASMMTKAQKNEAIAIFGKGKRVNSIDYVGAWYYKAAKLMHGTTAKAAFVSTNSITQGEQVAPLWEKLLTDYKIHIDFAYRTFAWDSEAKEKAAVHCVIIGFSSADNHKEKRIYTSEHTSVPAKNINPYLVDAPDILISSRGAPLCDVPTMTAGNKPADGGNLILSHEERDELISKDKSIEPCIRRYVGSRDFINGNEIRYCLWLKGVSPTVYRKNPEIMRRLDAVREMRLASSAAPTRAYADRPYLFFSSPQTDNNYLCIPEVSSERRRYIPIGFMSKDIIASNKLLIVPGATIYHFGILTSNVHMAWMRTVCGRMKSDYSYSGATVYNTFPWPSPTEAQREKIERTAQVILDARALYPDSSLADLYDDLTMPPELRKAHQQNDKAVMEAYGFDYRSMTESSCVAELMWMYQQLTDGK